MKLRHHIAEGGDIELVAFGDFFERAADAIDLGHQLRLRDFVEIDDVNDVGPARHQHQPGVMCVLHHQHAAEGQVADVDGVLLELSVQLEGGRGGHSVSRFLPCSVAGSGRADNSVVPAFARLRHDFLWQTCGRSCGKPEARAALAFRPVWPQIGTGRLAVDEPLANRVRSGRKQP